VTYLLDVNILVALMDPMHSQSDIAHRWFAEIGTHSWATCPITQNGVIRIASNPRFTNIPGNPRDVAEIVRRFVAHPDHQFWPDDISLLDASLVDTSRLLTPGQITDSYLLALAIAHGGKLATLDRRLITDAAKNGALGVHLVTQ
jgi:toxin-antitoxin system PIN domain toxin